MRYRSGSRSLRPGWRNHPENQWTRGGGLLIGLEKLNGAVRIGSTTGAVDHTPVSGAGLGFERDRLAVEIEVAIAEASEDPVGQQDRPASPM